MHLLAPRRLALPLAALGLVAAGCGGDPPAPPPFTPSTAASSPTPTGPVEPVLPEAAKQPTAGGAKAFAEFYWDIATFAQATGDTKGLRALGAQTCKACEAGARTIEELYANGATVRGGSYTPAVVRLVSSSRRLPAYLITVRLQVSPQVITYPNGKRKESLSPVVRRVRMVVNFLQGSWIVALWEGA